MLLYLNYLKKITLILSFYFILIVPSQAYIDPFTGAFILQALAAVFATIIFWLGYPVRLIKKIINKFKDKSKNRYT